MLATTQVAVRFRQLVRAGEGLPCGAGVREMRRGLCRRQNDQGRPPAHDTVHAKTPGEAAIQDVTSGSTDPDNVLHSGKLIFQSLLSDSSRRSTLGHRQSRILLGQIVSSLSQLPSLLDLEEPEVDEILEELLANRLFQRDKRGARIDLLGFKSNRPEDEDALWLKTNYHSVSFSQGKG